LGLGIDEASLPESPSPSENAENTWVSASNEVAPADASHEVPTETTNASTSPEEATTAT
jgi:hypothetical protein